MAIDGKYKTIKASSEGIYKEKGSKFYAYAYPCKEEEKAKELIAVLRKQNPQAVHVCFAWRFGVSQFRDRFSDDGEPNNSAGKPIFGQIVSKDVTNVLLAVVRYYGGTKLGVGGLIQAYKAAVEDALSGAEIVKKQLTASYLLAFRPELIGQMMQLITQQSAIIMEQGFENNLSTLKFKVPVSGEERLLNALQQYPGVEHKLIRREQ